MQKILLSKIPAEVEVLFHNSKPITVDVPQVVELLVVETPPNFKGDTTSGSRKPAKLETGLTVQVPLRFRG